MKKVSIFIPTHGGINQSLFEWMLALLKRKDFRFDVGMMVDRPTMSSRNRLCYRTLKHSESDYMMTIDSDQVPYIDADKRVAYAFS